MAEGFAGVPRGALSAYLGVEAANRRGTLEELQQATAAQGLLAQMQAQGRQKQYEQELAGLGPNPEPGKMENLAAKYSKPGDVLHYISQERSRQAQVDANREMARARLEQAKSTLEMQNQWKNTQFGLIANETERKKAADAWKQEYDRQLLDLKKNQQQLQMSRDLDKTVQGLGTALERANLPEADATLRSVEDALNKTPNLSEYITGPKSKIPDRLVEQNIREGRQAAQRLFNITLKNRSGAAVTIPEFERLKQEFGMGIWKDPAQFKAGVDQARSIIGQHYRSVASGFGEEGLNAYNENLRRFGGTPLLEPGKADPLGIR